MAKASAHPFGTRVAPLADQRLQPPAGRVRSHFGLFCHLKGIVNLNSEVAHSAFKLGMAEQ
jgi:hypothetical protein